MIEHCFTTRAGKDKENEDCFRTVSADGVDVFVLTDGMGGRSRGAEAAHIVAEAVCGYPWDREDVESCIAESLCNADSSLRRRSEEMHCKMGCAVGCLVIADGEIFYAGLGDVRLYIRGVAGDYKQVSTDDVLVGKDGQTFLSKSIRGRGVRLPIQTIVMKPDDIFQMRLCTDGYYRNDEMDDATVVDVTLPLAF